METSIIIEKEALKKLYSKEELRDMLKGTQLQMMECNEKIIRLRMKQQQLVKNADIIAEILGGYLEYPL